MDRQINRIRLMEMCRICLQNKNNEDGSTDIMEATIDSLNISLSCLFRAFTALPVVDQEMEGFPTLICTNCLKTLVLAYEFQLKCIQSDQRIRMVLECSTSRKSVDTDDNFEIPNYDPIKPETDNSIFLEEHFVVDSYRNTTVKDELESIPELPKEEIDDESDEQIGNKDASNKVRKTYKNKIVKCKICSRTFNKGYNLLRHLKKVHKTELPAGGISDEPKEQNILVNEDASNKKRKIYKIQIVKCKICSRTFNKSYNLLRHLKVHETAGKPFECKFCKRRFAEESLMVTHQNNHSEDDLRQYDNKDKLDALLTDDDDDVDNEEIIKYKKKIYKCMLCSRSFDKHSNLVRHSIVHKPEGKPFECEICKKRFAVKSRLICHSFIHKNHKLDEDQADNKSTDPQTLEIKTDFAEQSECEEKSHTCLVCNMQFPSQTVLQIHSKIHESAGKPYQCKVCNKQYVKEDYLIRHELNHSKDVIDYKIEQPTLYQCTECPREFLNEQKLSLHKKAHRYRRNSGRTCDYCKKTFFKLFNLKRHMKIHIYPKLYSCRQCDKTFADHLELVEHRKDHNHSEKPYVCSVCNKGYHKVSTLEYHRLKHEAVKTPHLCSICGKSYGTLHCLNNHYKTHYKLFQCSICSLRLSTKAKLKLHLITHTSIKPFKCKICAKGFTRICTLNQHIRQCHSNGEIVKPHLCTVCDKRFRDVDSLKRHVRTHTGEKPYKCEFCDRAFAQSGDLRKHRRIHVGYDIYKCKECPTSFQKYTELKLHLEQHYLPQLTSNPDLDYNALLLKSTAQTV